MQGSFDRFTERARAVLTLAQEEAQRFNHNYIGPEHLLLGMVREGEGVAAKVLANLGVELSSVREAVEDILDRGETQPVGEIGLTPRSKKVIELSVDEARRLGHHYIGTEHLLLGILRQDSGIAAGVLERLGVNLDQARAEVLKILIGSPSPPPISTRLARRVRAPESHRWEYLVVQTGHRYGTVWVYSVNGEEDPRFPAGHAPLQRALEVLGDVGWELAAIDPTPRVEDQPAALYVFKRPKR